MSRGRSEKRIGQRDFSNAPGLREGSCAENYATWRMPVCIENDSPPPIADRSPVRLQHAFSGQLPGAKLFIVPKNVALRMGFFCQQAIGQPDGLRRFTVVKGAYLDSSAARELLKNRLSIFAILGGVDNYLA